MEQFYSKKNNENIKQKQKSKENFTHWSPRMPASYHWSMNVPSGVDLQFDSAESKLAILLNKTKHHSVANFNTIISQQFTMFITLAAKIP